MTLIVETGQGVANAESFVTLAEYRDYLDKRGMDYSGFGDDTALEQQIRRAADFLSRHYRFKGLKAHAANQLLSWPRISATDEEGNYIGSDEIPIKLKYANIELAFYEGTNPNGLNPSFVQSSAVKREKIGDLEVEYATGANSVSDLIPRLTAVNDLISGLVHAGASNLDAGAHVSIRAVRG